MLSYLGLLYKLEVSQGGQLKCACLQSVTSLVDDEDIQDNVILIDIDIGLSVYRVGETSQLSDLCNTLFINQKMNL